MANKLRPESGQPGITAFLNPNECTAPSPQVGIPAEVKKRTPPSTEKKPYKRPYHEKSEQLNMNPENPEPMDVADNRSEEEESESDSEEDSAGALSVEQLAFERRLTKSLSKLMKKELKSVKSDLKKLSKCQIKQEKHIKEFVSIKEENRKLKIECEKVLKENKDLRNRITKIENRMLNCNVVLHGLREDPWELESNRLEEVINAISYTIDEPTEEKQLEVARKICIKSTKRVGMYSSKKNRPISVSFERYCDADYVITNKRYLPRGVYADKEYSEETENNRRILRPIYRAARNSNSYSGKCKMEGDTLTIKGLSYTVADIHRLPEDLNGFHVTSKTDDSKVCFFGELNPFSNFHKCQLNIDGNQFHSAEQFISYKKALFFNEHSLADSILQIDTPLACKQVVRNITNFDAKRWNENAKVQCKPGIEAKFLQNPSLLNILMSTGTKKLAEASYDNVFGTGVPLHSQECLDETKWEGIGLLGEILMEIRSSKADIIGNNTSPQPTSATIGDNTISNSIT